MQSQKKNVCGYLKPLIQCFSPRVCRFLLMTRTCFVSWNSLRRSRYIQSLNHQFFFNSRLNCLGYDWDKTRLTMTMAYTATIFLSPSFIFQLSQRITSFIRLDMLDAVGLLFCRWLTRPMEQSPAASLSPRECSSWLIPLWTTTEQASSFKQASLWTWPNAAMAKLSQGQCGSSQDKPLLWPWSIFPGSTSLEMGTLLFVVTSVPNKPNSKVDRGQFSTLCIHLLCAILPGLLWADEAEGWRNWMQYTNRHPGSWLQRAGLL